MISPHQYKQIALSAELEGLRPTLLDAEQMQSKLADLGIDPNSTLGRQALSGSGPLFTPGGDHYLLDTPKNLARAAAGKQCAACPELLAATDAVARNGYGLACHAACAAHDAQRVNATTSGRPLGHQRRTTLDLAADLYCGERVQGATESSHLLAVDDESKTLLDRTADLYCGPRGNSQSSQIRLR